MKPILSICIPTYNRSVYLKKCIDSIVYQMSFIEGKVEVVISDNASNDDTYEIIQPYLYSYINIHYYRNDENIRDKNFPVVISKAHGLVRKLCNDTLIFEENSLYKMCLIIEKYGHSQPVLVWANGSGKNEESIYECSFRRYVKSMSYWITSIACFSIWEDDCIEIVKDFRGCDQSLWQVNKQLEMASSKNVVIINEHFTDVQQVEKKNISYGLYKVFYENYFSLLEPYIERGDLKQEDKEYLEKDLLFSFFKNWVIQWKMNSTDLVYSQEENLKEKIWETYSNKPYWNSFLRQYYFGLFYQKLMQWKMKIVKKVK